MKNFISLVALALVSVACGRQDVPATHSNNPPRADRVTGDTTLRDYLNRYYLDASRFSSTFVYADVVSDMKFVEGFDKENVVGRCYVYMEGGRPVKASGEIHIKKSYWDTINEPSRMGLMYHEITHCAQGREHDPEGSETIMAPAMLGEDTYLNRWYDLVKQLFTKPSAPVMSLVDEGPVLRVFEMQLVEGKLVEVVK